MYRNTTPTAGQKFIHSQRQMNENFNLINQVFGLNHTAFNAATQGNHEKMIFVVAAADPVTLVNEVALYGKVSALTGHAELCMRRELNGAVIELTAYDETDGVAYTQLPCGLILQTGVDEIGVLPGATRTINYRAGAGITAFTTVYGVKITNLIVQNDIANPNWGKIELVSFNNTGFTIRNTDVVNTRFITHVAYGV